MEHPKTYRSRTLRPKAFPLIIEGPVSSDALKALSMHPELDAFREPDEQMEALQEIASLPEGRIIITRHEHTIVGYVTFHYPDEMERWSQPHLEDLLELGAVEVSNDYRSLGLGKHMIQLAFEGGDLDSYIVFTTEYYWHWDLKGSGLDVWDYRKMMERLMQVVDMAWCATDDPEICSHPANCLMVRVGSHVPLSSVESFDRIRFQRRFMY